MAGIIPTWVLAGAGGKREGQKEGRWRYRTSSLPRRRGMTQAGLSPTLGFWCGRVCNLSDNTIFALVGKKM